MHADHPGDYGVAGVVDGLSASRDGDGRGRPDGGDLAVIDDDGLVFGGSGATTVDDAHVRQGDGGRADGEEGLQSRRKAVLGKGSRNDDKDGGEFHRYIVPFEARLKIFYPLRRAKRYN